MSSPSSQRRPPNSCRQCGATSYGPIIARDASGALRPTGQFRCTGCDVVFENPKDWRVGPAAAEPAPAPAAAPNPAPNPAPTRPGPQQPTR